MKTKKRKAKRTKEEKRVRAISSNESLRQRVQRMRDLQIHQVGMPPDNPTPEEQERFDNGIEEAKAQFRLLKDAGVLKHPIHDCDLSRDGAIRKYGRVMHGSVPVWTT